MNKYGFQPVKKLRNGNYYDSDIIEFLDQYYLGKDFNIEALKPVYITQTFYVKESKMNDDTEEIILQSIKNYVKSLNTKDNIVYKENELLILSCFNKAMEIVENNFKSKNDKNED